MGKEIQVQIRVYCAMIELTLGTLTVINIPVFGTKSRNMGPTHIMNEISTTVDKQTNQHRENRAVSASTKPMSKGDYSPQQHTFQGNKSSMTDFRYFKQQHQQQTPVPTSSMSLTRQKRNLTTNLVNRRRSWCNRHSRGGIN